MTPTQQWLEHWEQVKEILVAPEDLNVYFTQKEIQGKALDVMDIGLCTLPSGALLVRDPLVYLGDPQEKPYFQVAPKGAYPTEVSVILPSDGDCARYAAVRLCFSENKAVKYCEALIGSENLEGLNEGDYFGFGVDAGLGCICDAVVHEAYCAWLEQWEQAHPNNNVYDDYFAALFQESYQKAPTNQRSGGDWLNWTIPNTDYQIPMFQTGFGDGVYPVYWGMDEGGNICQLVIQFIDIALAYKEVEQEEV